MDKVIYGIVYEQVPEERFLSCYGCAVHDDLELCALLDEDDDCCSSGTYMIYKEKEK